MSSNIHVQIIFESYMIVSHCYLGSPRIPRGPCRFCIFFVECCHWRLQVEVKEARQLHEEHGWWVWLVLGKEVNGKRLCRGVLTIEL